MLSLSAQYICHSFFLMADRIHTLRQLDVCLRSNTAWTVLSSETDPLPNASDSHFVGFRYVKHRHSQTRCQDLVQNMQDTISIAQSCHSDLETKVVRLNKRPDKNYTRVEMFIVPAIV